MSLWTAVGTIAGSFFGAPMVGAAIGSALDGQSAQREANRTNQEQAQLNRDFQERMSSTAYQRAVVDMEAAGLNPMLAYSQGGASTPGGTPTAAAQSEVGAGMSNASSLMQVMTGLQGMQQSRAQTDLLQAQAARTRAETVDNAVHTAIALNQEDVLWAQGRNVRQQTRVGVADEDLRRLQAETERYRGGREGVLFDLDNSSFQAALRERAARAVEAESSAAASKYSLSRSKAESSFYDKAESFPMWARTLMELLRGGSSAVGSVIRGSR